MITVVLVSVLLLYSSNSVETKSWPAWSKEISLLDVSSGLLHSQFGRSFTPRSSNRLDDDTSSEEHLDDSNEDADALRGGVYAGGCAHPNHRLRDIARSTNFITGLPRKPSTSILPRNSKELSKSRVPVTVVWEEATPVHGPNFRREFETSNGIRQSVIGYEGEAGQANMRGLFSWPLSGGRAFFMYEADENGYYVESPQLPVAPEIPYPMPEHAIQQIRFAEQQKSQGITFDLQGNPIYPNNWSPQSDLPNIGRPQQSLLPSVHREAEGFIGQLAEGSTGVGLTPAQWGNIWEPEVIN